MKGRVQLWVKGTGEPAVRKDASTLRTLNPRTQPPLNTGCTFKADNFFENERKKCGSTKNIGPVGIPPPLDVGRRKGQLKKKEGGGGYLGGRNTTHSTAQKSDITQRSRSTKLALFRDPFAPPRVRFGKTRFTEERGVPSTQWTRNKTTNEKKIVRRRRSGGKDHDDQRRRQ